MRSVKGYRILTVQYPPIVEKPNTSEDEPDSNLIKDEKALKQQAPLTADHYLYLKEHHDHANPQNNGKVLFVGNVDYYLTISYDQVQEYLTLLFQTFGEIESISLSEADEDTTKFAHILFQKKSSVKYILQTATDEDYRRIFTNDVAPYLQSIRPKNIIGNGNLATIQANLREMFPIRGVNEEELQRRVNEFMADFDEKERIELFERKEMRNQPDEDGFVTVVSRSKRKHDETLKSSDEVAGSKRHQKKRKTTELKNFYSFQIKEEKMKQLDIMRKRFEENKNRIQKMKEQRKFNPFA